MRGRRLITALAAVALAGSGTACGALAGEDRASTDRLAAAKESEEGRGWLDDADGESGGGGAAGGGTADGTAADGSSTDAAAVEAFGSAASTGVGGPTAGPAHPATTVPAAGGAAPVGLRAGSTDDNERWDDYLRYRTEFLGKRIPIRDVDVSERHVLRVVDRDGVPILGARVRVVAEGRERPVVERTTYADGRALLFPKAAGLADGAGLRVTVKKGDAEVTVPLPRDRSEHRITLPVRRAPVTKVDVHLLLDATGSMGDEIGRLKQHLTAVAARIGGRGDGLSVRFGLTAYRDRGDAYVTRTFDLTDDVRAFDAALREVTAEGGGDTPEALSAGLRAAVREPSWRGDDTVKLVFLVADAAPQLDDPEQADYAEEIQRAAAAGIKVHPIASSGLDDQGEFVFRQLAQITTGRFVFLTYGADGGPGDTTTHHVDKYAVLSLDELVVRLIEEELGRRPAASGQQ